jgi:hypothetical protein
MSMGVAEVLIESLQKHVNHAGVQQWYDSKRWRKYWHRCNLKRWNMKINTLRLFLHFCARFTLPLSFASIV